jgi:PAS domain S-box-containing protein
MSWIRAITSSGTGLARSKSEKRNIILSNYICLVAALANVVLVIGRVIFGFDTLAVASALLPGSALFLLPIVFNRIGMIVLSRLALCWVPAGFLMFAGIKIMQNALLYESSTYAGFRYILLATTCFPFLVFDLKDLRYFLPGLTGPLFLLLCFDPIMSFFDVGYSDVGLAEPSYYFNNVRAFVAVLVIGFGFLFLKILIEKNEQLNEQLIADLDKKNRLIQSQAESKVLALNEELRKNLEQLKEREFILNESQRIARIGSWEYRVRDRYLFWSDQMYNIFGLDKSNPITPDSLSHLLLENHRQLLDAAIAKLLSDGVPLDFNVQAKTPLGYLKWLRIYAYPVYDASSITGVRGICHDITFFKEAEEKLMRSEHKYRSLFEQASDAITINDFNGSFREVNQSFCNMLGYSRDELLQMNIAQLIGETQLRERPIAWDSLRNGERILSERMMRHKDGSLVHVESNLKRFGDNEILAVARDTTELRRVQREIELSEARFRGAFEESAIGMTLVDIEGRWLKVNRRFCGIVGYAEQELLGKRVSEITHVDDHSNDAAMLEHILNGTETVEFKKRFVHKDGKVVSVKVNVSLVHDRSGNPQHLVAQIEDITDLIRMEEEKEHARYLLNERIKELTTLHRTSQVLNDEGITVHEAMNQVVFLLPFGWQFSDVCAARIMLNGDEFTSPNYSKGVDSQYATFDTDQGISGRVEVVYLEQCPPGAEGPFLLEERELLNTVAEMIRVYFVRKQEAEALIRSEANLSATINTTDTMVWSVDRELKVVTFNQTFADYMLKRYGIQVQIGMAQYSVNVDNIPLQSWEDYTEKWRGYYAEALEGRPVNVEDKRFERYFRYRLNPIKVSGEIIGVSVFADDVTEMKLHEQQMAEANKKIGELKLMALRSVMSPHFIFNVLNSIQYFIAKNDRVNAINYLSTFSKLIRTVLTHSVDNRIKLSDEIELLKNYVILEMTRFENRFNFVLDVEGDIDVDAISIPSLLIQPYVENAILHGLYNRQGQGTLTLKVSVDEDDFVLFTVEDNGIGRKAAMELRKKNFPSHKSMGINLTEERIRLITQSNDTAVRVEDLEENGSPAGTRVTIRVKGES